MTYPNQRIINIHRKPLEKSGFLGINNESWQAAARDLGAYSFVLYIYLACNANNYQLALSAADVRQTIGMARSTFHDQFHRLVDKGYLVNTHGNTYEFFEVPQPRDGTQSNNDKFSAGEACPPENITILAHGSDIQSDKIEINNKEIPDKEINRWNPKEETKGGFKF